MLGRVGKLHPHAVGGHAGHRVLAHDVIAELDEAALRLLVLVADAVVVGVVEAVAVTVEVVSRRVSAGSVIQRGGRVVVAGRRVRAARDVVPGAEARRLRAAEIATRGDRGAGHLECVGAITIGAADAVAEAVVDRQVVASLGQAGGLHDSATLSTVRPAGPRGGAGLVREDPGELPGVVVKHGGYREVQAADDAGAIVDRGVRIVVAGRRIGATTAGAVVPAADSAVVVKEAGAVVHGGARVIVAGGLERASEAAEVTGAIVDAGIRVIVAGRRIRASEVEVVGAELDGLSRAEGAAGGDDGGIHRQRVAARIEDAVAEAVEDFEGVAPIAETDGLLVRGAGAGVRTTREQDRAGAVCQRPGGFSWPGVRGDVHRDRDAISDAGAIVNGRVRIVVAACRVGAAVAAEVAHAIVDRGVRIVVAGRGIGTPEPAAHAERGGFRVTELSAGGHESAVHGEGVIAQAIGAADAIAEAVEDGEGVASVPRAEVLGDGGTLVRVRASRGNRGPGAVHQTPGRFARVVVEQDGQAEGQALGEAGAVVEDGVRIIVAGRRIGAAAAAAVIATAHAALVEGEAGAIVDDGGRVEVAGRAVGAAPAGAVVPGADSAQVEVGTAAVVHRGVRIVVAARRVGAAVDDAADADVVHGDVGDVGHAGAGGIAVDQLDAPFSVAGEAGCAEVDRGRVRTGVTRSPVSRPQNVVAEVGTAGGDGGGEPAELDALAGRSGDDHQHVGGPAS